MASLNHNEKASGAEDVCLTFIHLALWMNFTSPASGWGLGNEDPREDPIQASVLSIYHVDDNNQSWGVSNWQGTNCYLTSTTGNLALQSKSLEPIANIDMGRDLPSSRASQIFCAALTLTDKADLVRDVEANIPWRRVAGDSAMTSRIRWSQLPSEGKLPVSSGH
ncbi:hypothetical protein LZ32DRAFT_611479 [Colletotrichum eremochloae]|nr:hypothetical protein LZ32DRAFT_611479 [Colletotrichum eremochloae]